MAETLAPHSVEAEEATIGCTLINPEFMVELASIVQPADFFIIRNGWIWEAIASLHQRREAIDYLTVVNELEETGRLAEAGGAAYVLSLVNKTPSALNAAGYARIVERMAVRRRLLDTAGRLARLAHADETDLDEIIGQAERALFDVTRSRTDTRARTSHEMMSAHFDRTTHLMRNPDQLPGIPTGLADLDALLGGVKRGKLTLIGGRPGMGKTALLENILRHAAKRGHAALFVSIEMVEEELASRQIAAEGSVNLKRIEDAKLTETDYNNYIAAIDRLAALDVKCEFPSRLTPTALATMVQRAVYDLNVEIVAVDYLQLMTAPGFSGGDNRVAEMTYISREAKLIAKEYDVALVAAAQLSRKVEERANKRPLLSDLRESGSLEQDADVVLFPYRDSYYNDDAQENVVEMNVAKHRNGPTGMVRVMWQPEYVRFVNAAPNHIDLSGL